MKKRTKKLLSTADITMRETGLRAGRYRRRDKSLLVLFFRKEHFLPGFLESQESISTRVGIIPALVETQMRFRKLRREMFFSEEKNQKSFVLARVFGTTAQFWINLQSHHDLSKTAILMRDELAAITPLVEA